MAKKVIQEEVSGSAIPNKVPVLIINPAPILDDENQEGGRGTTQWFFVFPTLGVKVPCTDKGTGDPIMGFFSDTEATVLAQFEFSRLRDLSEDQLEVLRKTSTYNLEPGFKIMWRWLYA